MAVMGNEPIKAEDLKAVASKLGQDVLYAGTMGNIGTISCVGSLDDYDSLIVDLVKNGAGKRLQIPSAAGSFNWDGPCEDTEYSRATITQNDGAFQVQKTSTANFELWRLVGKRSGGGQS